MSARIVPPPRTPWEYGLIQCFNLLSSQCQPTYKILSNLQRFWRPSTSRKTGAYFHLSPSQCIPILIPRSASPAFPTFFWIQKQYSSVHTKYPAKALVEALTLIMKNNRMRFGDIIAQQLTGIAMDMVPAPAIANLYVALFEQDVILPRFKMCLPLYLRFIDDELAVWKSNCNSMMDNQLIHEFKDTINASGLK